MKHYLLRIVSALLLLGLLCGCSNNDTGGYTVPPPFTTQDYPGIPFSPAYTTLEEYDKLLDKSYIPQGYVSYYDVAFIGEFYKYTPHIHYGGGGKPEEVHKITTFQMIDPAGYYVSVYISMVGPGDPNYEERECESLENYDDFRYAPESFPENVVEGTGKEYCYRDIRYVYVCMGDDRSPRLSSVHWVYSGYYINIQYSRQDPWDGHSVYPEAATDTFVGRLLNPETAQGAVEQLNSIIWWVNFRDGFIKWLPVSVPVLCVAAVGTVYLVICRKRRKAVGKTAMPEEEIT